MKPFDYDRDFKNIDMRACPHAYQVGKGEQGVLSVEPYKSEILPLWRFKNPDVARGSSEAIFTLFQHYKAAGDFVGMDMARKFLQMGYTRARRYANHKGGRKRNPDGTAVPDGSGDPVKAEIAALYRVRWREIADDPAYQHAKAQHQRRP